VRAARVSPVLMIALASVIAGSLFLALPLSGVDLSIAQTAEAGRLPMEVRDVFKLENKMGDANRGSAYVKSEQDFVDPDNHCEFCLRVEYIPGPDGKAGLAYGIDKGLDIKDAKRLTFFVKREKGGEKVRFKAAGKDFESYQLGKGLVKSQKFAAKTSDITLGTNWEKYEIDLDKADMIKITQAFGFDFDRPSNGKPMIFYLKGVTIDTDTAKAPLPTIAE
jgi:hypothetical protein